MTKREGSMREMRKGGRRVPGRRAVCTWPSLGPQCKHIYIYIYIYICICIHPYIHTYIYIYIERERERHTNIDICIYILCIESRRTQMRAGPGSSDHLGGATCLTLQYMKYARYVNVITASGACRRTVNDHRLWKNL